jgi:uncharacterized membrane protein
MATCCPYLTEWEQGFLRSILLRTSLSEKQESTLRAIVHKAEGEVQ